MAPRLMSVEGLSTEASAEGLTKVRNGSRTISTSTEVANLGMGHGHPDQRFADEFCQIRVEVWDGGGCGWEGVSDGGFLTWLIVPWQYVVEDPAL